MKRPRIDAVCPRGWQVEAARDGRLSGEELANFEAHRRRCKVCEHEASRIAQIAMRLRLAGPPPLDSVSFQRLRLRVLARADALLTRPERKLDTLRRPSAAVLLAAVAAGLVAFHYEGTDRVRPPAPATSRRDPVAVQPMGEAAWRESRSSREQRIVLDSGTLRVVVSRGPGDPRVVLDVPDGEIEDRGTTFSVTVAGATTTLIRVEQGAVLFRRDDGTAFDVPAGQTWRSVSAGVPAAMLAAPEGWVERHEAPSASASRREQPHTKSARPAPRHDPVGAPPSSSVEDSDAGMAAEDFAYLRLLALVQEGRRAEAALAARAYLERFPSGFRRVEVLEVAARP